MNIIYIGKFGKIYDEEYIARSFEMLGHNVLRMSETIKLRYFINDITEFKPDMVIYAKLATPNAESLILECKKRKIKTVCWVFDLYWGYVREHLVHKLPAFKSDYVFTTDGGNNDKWKSVGVNHQCVRQGIYTEDCFMLTLDKIHDVIFIGSDNIYNPRKEFLDKLATDFNFKWFGKQNTDEVRSKDLNEVIARSKIVVGDSFPSDYYWSNRVVETLGRGGFLIHREVKGLKDEYPDIVTYDGSYEDLKSKIDYYLKHDKEREAIIKKNFKLVKENYTCDKKCQELINYVNHETSK
jgi:hypothetical protein